MHFQKGTMLTQLAIKASECAQKNTTLEKISKRKIESQFQKNSKNKNSQHPIKANQMKNK
jgi:hypothetical protein